MKPALVEGARDRRHSSVPILPPPPIADELARPHLVDRLAARWTNAVTLVVAGPGFGKSTILAQAMRAHAVEPCGIEGWSACQPGFEQAGCLAAALVTALGCVPSGDDPLVDVLRAFREYSPLDVCLVVDDAHEVPAGSSSARLLVDLVRRLPANAHLVLAGRDVPDIPGTRHSGSRLSSRGRRPPTPPGRHPHGSSTVPST